MKRIKVVLSCIVLTVFMAGCSSIGKMVHEGTKIVQSVNGESEEEKELRMKEITLKSSIIFGCLEQVKEELDKGVDINMTNVSKDRLNPEKSPIWMAIYSSRYKIVEYLINRGADLNYSKNIKGETVFTKMMDDQYCYVKKFLPMLIEHGADINATSDGDWTPLETLIVSDRIPDIYKIELTDELIKNGAEVRMEALESLVDSMSGKAGDTIGGTGCMGSKIIPYIEQIVKKQNDLSISNIMQVAIEGNSKKVLSLVKRGEYEREDQDNQWKLCGAVAGYCNIDVLKACIEKSKFNEYQMNSLLLIASRGNQLENVKYLIEKGADINYLVDEKISPLVLALLNNNTEIADYLLDSDAKIVNSQWSDAISQGKSEACAAALNENKEMLERILKENEGLPKDEQEAIISQVFHLCAYFNKEEFAEYLFEKGYGNKVRKGILSDICCEENLKITQMFVEHGIDIEGDGGESSALKTAIKFSTPEVVKVLVDNGAKIDYGSVLYAIWRGEMDKIKCLVEAGADLTMIDEEGKTLLEKSKEYSENVKQYLIEHGAK
ncbi:ankyrin repeat domain-containing protein [Anaerosacchariphilus polymeriproducens]|uniref:Ankyrin repeat domain-containing protein n=1 Tax=Anaerosacchariphilus polymeriproducens TaxID=1812858 RepID=A0A371ARW8_9FIRM|nr:ankyrin repeat domain-containing protein [Anaerosacchariphilus polymeriproducens]RDU22323.1 hypothetical protein DWV06_13580 [Anaerosacchariphilus polymeriproducens]